MKKIIALFCVALLLLGLPSVAFGDNAAQLAAVKFEGEVDGGHNDRAKDLTYSCAKATFDSGIITNCAITVNADSALPKPTWDLSFFISAPVSIPTQIDQLTAPYKHKIVDVAAAQLQFKNTASGSTVITGPLSSNDGTMTFDYQINPSMLPASASEVRATDDLAYYLYAMPIGTDEVKNLTKDGPLPVAQKLSGISISPRTTTLVTVLVDPTIPDPVENTVATNKSTPDSDSDSDADTPGWRDIPVEGSTEISARGALEGLDAAETASAYLSVKRITSGSAFNELRAAAGANNLNKAFDVTLLVNGTAVHNDFGRLRLEFEVGTEYNGRKATVWHLHNDGRLTSESTLVIGGNVSVEVTDLSAFGIDIEGVTTQADDGMTSPKTGQPMPAGTAPLTLAVAAALGTAALLLTRRRSR